jgi:2-oxoglutarate dehydrogenase E2 component (dihydrolipoamide succinyltransferase)
MAIVPIKVPPVGESITEGILSRWLKPDGARVTAGEPLFELETDKASQEVSAEITGRLNISAAEGSTVAIGSQVGTLDSNAAPNASKPAASSNAAAAPANTTAGTGAAKSAPTSPVSPAARRLAAESGVDASAITGSGRGGLVTKGDVLANVDGETSPGPGPSTPQSVAAPSMRTTPAAATEPGVAPATSADAIRPPRETRKRMSGIRQKIAQRLVEAQQIAAILTTFNEADMTRVIDLRARYKETFSKKHGVGLGFMSFFVKAAVDALKAFPAVNGRVDGAEIVYNNFIDIGVAVSSERGLIVPVVRDADRLSFAAIEKTIADFAKRSKDNTISVADLQGGSFTITNGGVFGSLLSTPILNPPQSGILGMHSIQKRPVALDDQVVIRPMMYLALSYDHRIVDGREAVSFLVRIKECIENPERLMLEI